MSDCGGHDHCQRDELLARVEALEVVREAALRYLNASENHDETELADALEAALARAALACPPQQRGEK